MTEKVTVITLPGLPNGAGLAEHGVEEASHMIAKYRDMARRQKEDADAILAASDEDFRVVVAKGIIVQRDRRVLQEGRK